MNLYKLDRKQNIIFEKSYENRWKIKKKHTPHFLTLSFVFLQKLSFLSHFPNSNYLNLNLKIILVKKNIWSLYLYGSMPQAKFYVPDYSNNGIFFKHHLNSNSEVSLMINSNWTLPKPKWYVLQNTKVSQLNVFNFLYLLAICSGNKLKVLISWLSNIF